MPAPKTKAVCKRGHDIAVVGRRPTGGCRQCARESKRTGKPSGRPRKEVCFRGHPLTEENRYKVRGEMKGCRICRQANIEAYRLRKGMKPRSKVRIPADPVLEFIDRIGGKEFSRQASTILRAKASSVERMVWRARETRELTIIAADDLCVALGRHPVEVYGPAWFAFGAEEVASAV